MEFVDPSDAHRHQHRWLEWLGLEEPPPESDTWVPVVRGCHVDKTGSSRTASRLVDQLSTAGIEARQRSYEFDTSSYAAVGMFNGGVVTRIAVLVHNRDRARASEIAAKLVEELKQESKRGPEVSEAELTQLALDAGPPPEE